MCPSSPLVESKSFACDIKLDGRSRSSLAIPLPESHIKRTESELQLRENMAVAEYRDRCMFHRLVSGIRRRQELHYNFQRHVVDWNQCPDDDHRRPPSHPSRGRDGFGGRGPTCHVPPPIQDTERSIENIISTRCNPIESDEGTISNMTSDDSNDDIPKFENSVNSRDAQMEYVDEDWAIEGFDSNPTVARQSQDESNDIDYHLVFQMDL